MITATVIEGGTEISVTLPDESRYYEYPPTGEQLDSVTTIISGTNSKPWIGNWKGTQSAAWAVDNIKTIVRVLREDGRAAAVKLAAGAAERERAIKAEAGVYVHDVQEALILWAASPDRTGTDITIPLLPDHLQEALYDLGGGDFQFVADVAEWMVDGFLAFVSDFSPRFLAAEMAVYNQPLGYAGTLDMIVELDGYAISHGTGPGGADEIIPRPGATLTICIDTKTGKAMEGTWKEQLSAYRRAKECLAGLGEICPMPQTDCGMVLHLRPAYPDGYSLTLVSAGDDEAAWGRFADAAHVYRERQTVKDKPGTAVRALRADGTMPGPRLCDLDGEGYGRALSPLRKALGASTELADLARFTTADVLAVSGVGPKLLDAIRGMLADRGLCLQGEELLPVLGAVRATAEEAVA
jgi:hypothetical protein